MSYQKTNWQALPNTSTPIAAANLNKMEDGIEAANTLATTSNDGQMSSTDFKKINPQPIAANTDLNNITDVGWYYCNQNSTVATLSNCPTQNAFFMEVSQHAGKNQHIVTYETSGFKHYDRNYYNNTWGAWQEWKLTDTNIITGVKGNEENSYRTGNVNLTPENIGALPLTGGTVTNNISIGASDSSERGLRIYNSTRNVVFEISSGNAGIWDSTYSRWLIVWSNATLPNCSIKGNLVPYSGQTLGSSSNYWDELYAKSLNFGNSSLGNGAISMGSGGNGVLQSNSGYTVRAYSDVNTYKPMTASAFTVNSSRRYKENIKDITEERANKILDVNIVTFDYKHKPNGVDRTGVIAEDVAEIIPEVVTYTEIDGKQVPDAVDYSKFVPYLMKKIQMQEEEINELKQQFVKLKAVE